MSELKAFVARKIDDGTCDPVPCIEVYLKAEADKVIALLSYKANYNEEAYKFKKQELADTCRFYEDELRHHKYKRCLAMARWCRGKLNMSLGWDPTDGCTANFFLFYEKWQKRWLKIAEKFKEAK